MANLNNNNHEESSPLLDKQVEGFENNVVKPVKSLPVTQALVNSPAPEHNGAGIYAWTADGLPLGHGSVMGEPIRRTQWNSGLCACLGRNDHFCSSDLEVCKFFFFCLVRFWFFLVLDVCIIFFTVFSSN